MVAVVGGYFAAADGDDRAEAPSADEILNSFGLSDAIIDEYLPAPPPSCSASCRHYAGSIFAGILDHQFVLGLLTVNANDRTSLTAVGRCRYDVGVDVSRLPDDGPWDSGMGLESLEGTV
jgi:hypothetical protein